MWSALISFNNFHINCREQASSYFCYCLQISDEFERVGCNNLSCNYNLHCDFLLLMMELRISFFNCNKKVFVKMCLFIIAYYKYCKI